MLINALCLHNQIMANTWSDGPYCFYICINVEVRGGLYSEIAQKVKKAISWKNKIVHFQQMRHLQDTNRKASQCPTKAETYVCLSNRCSLESTDTFTEKNNQAAWRALVKWLKHSSKHSNETVVKKRRVWHAISSTLNIHLPETPEMSSHER